MGMKTIVLDGPTASMIRNVINYEAGRLWFLNSKNQFNRALDSLTFIKGRVNEYKLNIDSTWTNSELQQIKKVCLMARTRMRNHFSERPFGESPIENRMHAITQEILDQACEITEWRKENAHL